MFTINCESNVKAPKELVGDLVKTHVKMHVKYVQTARPRFFEKKKGEGAHGLTLKESCFIIDRSFLQQYSLNEI